MNYNEKSVKCLKKSGNLQTYVMVPATKKSMYFTLINIRNGQLKNIFKVDDYLWGAIYKAKLDRGFEDVTESVDPNLLMHCNL